MFSIGQRSLEVARCMAIGSFPHTGLPSKRKADMLICGQGHSDIKPDKIYE